MECCQCQQERQKYLKQICGESRGAMPWGRGFQARQTDNGPPAKQHPLPPWFCSPRQQSRASKQREGIPAMLPEGVVC